MNRTYRYRLLPTEDQRASLAQTAGACRFVYNLALEQRRDWWRQYRANTGHSFTYFSQSYELTALRAQVDWLAAAPCDALAAALRDLDRAFAAFFAGRSRFPTMRKRDDDQGFSLRGKSTPVQGLNAGKWSQSESPRSVTCKLRLTRAVAGTPKVTTIREDAGRWFVSITCEIEDAPFGMPPLEVGIDRGIANTLALSTGELLQMPANVSAHVQRRRKAQRVLARRTKGSTRRNKQRAKVASLWARERRARADWLHRTSTHVTRRFGLVAIEALSIGSMTASAAGTLAEPGKNVAQKRGLNRSILEQGWGTFERFLAYKLEATGGTLIRVPAAYSSQTCQSCGVVDARSRESQAVFRCVHCGHEDHADINAAKEILRRSTSELLVEGARQRPVETRTMGVAA